MKGVRAYVVVGYTAVCVAAAMPGCVRALKCPPDSVKVGNICIDTYEASAWQIPPSKTSLVKKVQAGKVTLADLTAGGATLLSTGLCTPSYPANFPLDGNWTPVLGSNPPSPGVYAVSIPGVLPSACTSWFQANQACLLSGKRLLTNLEWQGAAAGTPDPGTDNGTSDCNISTAGRAVNAGSRASCKSAWGVFDMVGNLNEWVADWTDLGNQNCTTWTAEAPVAGNDISCFGGDGNPIDPYGGMDTYKNLPGALLRGGDCFDGSRAGVLAVDSSAFPSINYVYTIGFRCAR